MLECFGRGRRSRDVAQNEDDCRYAQSKKRRHGKSLQDEIVYADVMRRVDDDATANERREGAIFLSVQQRHQK